jgi:predicted dehydrogenase
MTPFARLLGFAFAMTTLVTAADDARLIIVDPGHFHAALIQKDMYSFLSPRVSVYAPLAPELVEYLNRIQLLNTRAVNPTHWQLEVHTSEDYFERMLRERAGNAVVFSGRNRGKIDRIQASLDAGYHVFADKPWIITVAEMEKLERALEAAEKKNLAAYDIMTERFEITSILQRELVGARAVFGDAKPGSPTEPAVKARSVHHIMKVVAGVPLKRPTWFFDIDEYGEALADVGPHVVDLIQWTLFPNQTLDWRKDARVFTGKHWATPISEAQFKQVTGVPDFPAPLARWTREGKLEFFSNNSLSYSIKGVHAAVDILWNWEATTGGDVYEASFDGTRSRIELRQNASTRWVPEVYVVPQQGAAAGVFGALRTTVAELARRWPGLAIEEQAGEAHIVIPEALRVGHEAHFAQVAGRFFEFMKAPATLPKWEKAAMLTKYYITTKGVELAQHPQVAR